MQRQTVSFRLGSDKIAVLDELADAMERDRTYLLGEAVDAYLELQRWQIEQIRAGIAEADEGKVVPHQKVKSMASRWRRRG
jgi:predicted transcriptional regulator